jgi:hypothetical protein
MSQTSEMVDYDQNQVNGFTWTITFTSHGWFNPTMHTGAYEANNWEGPQYPVTLTPSISSVTSSEIR